MKMKGVDRCRGKREDTYETLQLNLMEEQLIFIMGKARSIPER